MARTSNDDLNAFIVVARERSFTRAAAQLGVSSSALSHVMRNLEERLGVRLLNRTTRSVAPTEAGERLIVTLTPHLEAIDAQLAALKDMRDRPAGTIRITAGSHPAESVLAPALAEILPEYPDINVEVTVDSSFRDIVTEKFDAGIRMGETIEKDMIAVRLGPDISIAVVASPAYFARYQPPGKPEDLTAHVCINMRFPTMGGLQTWEFEKDAQKLLIRVKGQLVVNDARLARQACLNGLGVACLPDHYVKDDIAEGRLIRVLTEWCLPFPGYHLFYPAHNRRQPTAAFSLLLKALKSRVD